MNKLFTLIFTVCAALMGCTAWAGPVTEGQARTIAANFMASHAIPTTNLRMAHKAPQLHAPGVSEKTAYYAFNGGRGGYVIVAGDDRAPAVLGYSDKGTFDPDNVPEAMQELLEGYAAQIEDLDKGAKVAAHFTGGNAIAPLVTAQWDQDSPYNILFPYLGRNRAYVGCVATAMAQVMYYWKWPARPSSPIGAYTSESWSIVMQQLPVVDFDWENMQDTYMMDDTTSAAALAAATLSLYCAQSVHMDFTPTGSGALSQSVPMALITYYGYSGSCKHVMRSIYTTQNWESTIYEELAARRPVLYAGSKNRSGHAYVCDGYDGNGMFHINWGWNGVSNGFFLLSVLDPDVQGAGSAVGSYGYVEGQSMTIGVQPGSPSTSEELQVTASHIEVRSYSDTRTSSAFNFSISQVTNFMNCMNHPISFDYGWGLYDSSNRLVQKLSTGFYNTMGCQSYISPMQTLMFGSVRSSGVFRIMPIYSERNANNWRPCVGASLNNIKVAISGNKCTITAQGDGGIPSYSVNSINVTGNMHPNRPVNITLNVTNTGSSRNDLIYMFANDRFVSESYVDLDKNASGDVFFQYTSKNAGTVNLTFTFDREGTDTLTSTAIVINPMPTASMSGTAKVLNVVDQRRRYILSNKFSIEVNATNNYTTAYNEDITVKLYKCLFYDYGYEIQSQTRTVSINPGQSTRVQFDLENVVDGWKYYAVVSYYSSGREKTLDMTDTYSIYFTEVPSGPNGDVNGDGEVNIADVNVIIDIILGNNVNSFAIERADVNGDGEVNIADVNATIDIILRS